MHAFQDSVPEFIQKRFSPDFISTLQGGRVGLRQQFFRSHSGSKIFIHDVLCHDARTWPISCLACFYAWVDLVIPMALCTLFRLFNFMHEQGVHEHASWNSCMHFRIQCLSSFKNDFHQISYPQCRVGGGFKTAILQKPIWKQDLHPQGPLP